MDIIIRKINSQDARQYIKLKTLVWRDAYKHIFPEEVFIDMEEKEEQKIKDFNKNYFNDDTKINYVAELNGNIIGLFMGRIDSGYHYFNEKGFADLEALYIHPNYQGLGIANRFKKIFIDWLINRNKTKYVIGVLKENKKARIIYEKWGGMLDDYSQKYVKLNNFYDEVFYTYEIDK